MKSIRIQFILLMACLLVNQELYSRISVPEQTALSALKKHLDRQDYKQAGKAMKKLDGLVMQRATSLDTELEKAASVSEVTSRKAQPTQAVNGLTDLVEAVSNTVQPTLNKHEQTVHKFTQEIFKHLPGWIKTNHYNHTVKKTAIDWKDLSHQWSTLLATLDKTKGHLALPIYAHIIAPYHKMLREQLKAKNKFMHAFLNKLGW